MDIKEYLKYRTELLKEARDEDGLINESAFIQTIVPSMLDAKLIDSEDFTETYYDAEVDGTPVKINGYIINESGERLQLFILNSESILSGHGYENNDFLVSTKDYYENIFKKAGCFIHKAIKNHLGNIQDTGAINALINHLSSSDGIDQYDVIEIFLISVTATIETRGQIPQPKRINFKDDSIKVKFIKANQPVEKEILIVKRLIDLNFLFDVMISQ